MLRLMRPMTDPSGTGEFLHTLRNLRDELSRLNDALESDQAETLVELAEAVDRLDERLAEMEAAGGDAWPGDDPDAGHAGPDDELEAVREDLERLEGRLDAMADLDDGEEA